MIKRLIGGLAAAAILCVCATPALGADTTLTQLPAATTLTGVEVAPLVQSAITKKATVEQFRAYMAGFANTFGGVQIFTNPPVITNGGLAISNGGTGATDAATARTNLGLPLGSSGAVICLASTACQMGSGQAINLADDGSNAGPNLYLLRTSASPAANDILGQLAIDAYNSAGTRVTFGVLRGSILDPTAGSESGCVGLRSIVGGALSTRLNICSGAYMQAASGGDMGAGTFNSNAYYVAGTNLFARNNAWTGDQSFAGKSTFTGHIVTATGTAPGSPTGCGTGGSVAGSDNAFRVSIGTGGSSGSCVVTFATPWTSIPICQVNDNSSGAVVTLPSITLTSVTIGGTVPAGDKVVVMCQG